MTPAEAHWWLNLASTAGIAILAVPTWSLNFRKKKLKTIRDALPRDPDSFRARVRAIVEDKWGRDVSDWRRIDEVCLLVGYLCVLGSAVARMFVAPG
jgi:hypothetical protein